MAAAAGTKIGYTDEQWEELTNVINGVVEVGVNEAVDLVVVAVVVVAP